jgi:hypothetical protein
MKGELLGTCKIISEATFYIPVHNLVFVKSVLIITVARFLKEWIIFTFEVSSSFVSSFGV